jgi:hypothetical protein
MKIDELGGEKVVSFVIALSQTSAQWLLKSFT